MGTKLLDFSKTTARERDVLDALVATDGSNLAMATDLGLAPATVAVHIQTIMLKTDCHSRVALAVAWARRGGGRS